MGFLPMALTRMGKGEKNQEKGDDHRPSRNETKEKTVTTLSRTLQLPGQPFLPAIG